MAIVRTKDDFGVATEGAGAFDVIYKPGVAVPFSGIYRCTGYGDEYALNKGNPAPPQNHHQHPALAGGKAAAIEWKLLVYAQTK
ncbi:MAG TPA: hypothetical protein VG734_09905 [Lacunisphaera sp.]|nr:hypothetical protein [Lacunisphaera sp.]